MLARTRFKFINEIQTIMFNLVGSGAVDVRKVKSSDNIADFFTNSVSKETLVKLLSCFDISDGESTTAYVR